MLLLQTVTPEFDLAKNADRRGRHFIKYGNIHADEMIPTVSPLVLASPFITFPDLTLI